MLALHAEQRRAELIQPEATLQPDKVDDIAVKDMLNGGQFPLFHDLPPITITDEVPSMAVGLSPALLLKAAMRGCRCSKVPKQPKTTSRRPQAITIIVFSLCASNSGLKSDC